MRAEAATNLLHEQVESQDSVVVGQELDLGLEEPHSDPHLILKLPG